MRSVTVQVRDGRKLVTSIASSPGENWCLAQILVPRPHFSHGKEKVAIHPVSDTGEDVLPNL